MKLWKLDIPGVQSKLSSQQSSGTSARSSFGSSTWESEQEQTRISSNRPLIAKSLELISEQPFQLKRTLLSVHQECTRGFAVWQLAEKPALGKATVLPDPRNPSRSRIGLRIRAQISRSPTCAVPSIRGGPICADGGYERIAEVSRGPR